MTSPLQTSNAKVRKTILQLVMGGVVGAVAMIAMLTALERHAGLLEDSGRLAALATALIYALMSAFVGFGTLVPGVGAKTLNVEDREEIAEQKQALVIGSLSFLLVAIFLGALALGSTPAWAGPLPTGVAALVAGAAVVILVALSIRYRNLGDEMMQLASKEASGILLLLLLATVGAKSAAAQLGYATPMAPLEFLASFFALYLVAVFVAVGRRGLLTPR
ncbi:hypothetical protein [Sphingomonas sp. LHG3406-1]|uniref:hypothetical protein n=1 Tax=Sphingomonas sp. LHG3406-1 TaxID=2804617 RepID=UPI0026280566|nr:hypothetical protein [Sphingomonas sp. LHG3406-1]